jgi:hypothetical protein
MTTDELHASELRDPSPPMPGARERALVASRAQQLGRRRRLVQGGSALAVVAALAVGVAALTAGGGSDTGSDNAGVEAAGGNAAPGTDRAAGADGLEGTVTGAPAGVIVRITLRPAAGGPDVVVRADRSGAFHVEDLAAGTYDPVVEWVDEATGTAVRAQHFPVIVAPSDTPLQFRFDP